MDDRHDPPTRRPRRLHPFPGGLPVKEQREQTLATVALLAGAPLAPTRLEPSKRSVFSGRPERPHGSWRQFGIPDQTAGGGGFPAPVAVLVDGAKDVRGS